MRLYYIANANLVHTWNWIQTIQDQGHEIRIFSYTPIQNRFPGFDQIEIIDLTQITNIPKYRFFHWANWLREYFTNSPPDILHAHQIQAAGWLGWLSGYHPFVISTWGSDLLIEPNKNLFRKWLVHRVISACDKLITPSPILKDVAQQLGVPGNKIIEIPWPIDLSTFTPYPDDRSETLEKLKIMPEKKIIFSPRSVTPLYNIYEIIIALSHIVKNQDQVHLVLLNYNSDAAYLRRLNELISQLELEDFITWLPGVSEAKMMAKLYRASDVMVSIPTSEGFGLSVYESLACGCPTIITDLPVFEHKIIHKEHALKIRTGDTEKLSASIELLLAEPDLAWYLSRNGYLLSQEMSKDLVSDRIDEMYYQLTKMQRRKIGE